MTPLYKIQLPQSSIVLYAKLERFNPTGTHKDRSIGPWIEYYRKQGIAEFAIASSGNSAISAAKYCAENKLKLQIFVSPKLEQNKEFLLVQYAAQPLRGLGGTAITLSRTKTPRRDAIRFCKKNKAVNLRASTDNSALIGYRSIAFELMGQLPRIDNIFIPTSSGATLEGVYDGFKEALPPPSAAGGLPSFFTVQTAKVHPIASYFDKDFKRENKSYATAIVDNIAHRRKRVIKICEKTGGGGFVISNKELKEARVMLCKISDVPHIEWQSALAFAGFLKWRARNLKESDKKISACLFTD